MTWKNRTTVALLLLGLISVMPQTAGAEEEPKKFEWKLLPFDRSPPLPDMADCNDEPNLDEMILYMLLKQACQEPMGSNGLPIVVRSPCEDRGLVYVRRQLYCWTVEGSPPEAANHIAGLASVEGEPLPCLHGGNTVVVVRNRGVCVQTPRELTRAIARNPRGSAPSRPPTRDGGPRRAVPARPGAPA